MNRQEASLVPTYLHTLFLTTHCLVLLQFSWFNSDNFQSYSLRLEAFFSDNNAHNLMSNDASSSSLVKSLEKLLGRCEWPPLHVASSRRLLLPLSLAVVEEQR